MRTLFLSTLALAAGWLLTSQPVSNDLRFVILGDRTGAAQPGVYEQVWRETAADHPDFVINVGDNIEGEHDATINAEWQAFLKILKPYQRYRLFFTPGNHDIWSAESAAAYQRYTKHPRHYSFNFGPAHFAVLDNSRTENLPDAELAWLEKDLQANPQRSPTFVLSHRPSWILNTVLLNPDFPLQRLAKEYGVRYIVAGHIHQMLHFELDGVTYLSMASSGGHLRNSKRYEDGWFFQHTLVSVHDGSTRFAIKETAAPYGQSRISQPADWGAAGLTSAK